MQRSRKGFTLAEVLVTLAIIGVVAALTIPTLIQSTNNDKFKTGAKKALSVLNQALTIEGAETSNTAQTVANTSIALGGLFSPRLNVIKTVTNTSEFYTSDGMRFKFKSGSTDNVDCAAIANNAALVVTASCYVLVDVNGDKGPNTVATAAAPSDVYMFGVNPSSVIPANPSADYDASGVFSAPAITGSVLTADSTSIKLLTQ